MGQTGFIACKNVCDMSILLYMYNKMKILGILSVVFSSLTIVWNGCLLAALPFILIGYRTTANSLGSSSQALLYKNMALSIEKMLPFTLTLGITKWLLAVALLVIGIGLIRLTPWSARAVRIWSVLAFIYVAFYIAVWALRMLPLEVTYGAYSATPGGQGLAYVAYGMIFFFVLLLDLPFPIVLLALLRKERERKEIK